MKAVVISEPNSIKIKEKDFPKISSNKLLVKIKSIGICGSDMHIIKGSNPFVTYPRIIGHECFGEIVDSGSNELFKEGDRVVIDPVNSCGNCYSCLNNKNNICNDLKVFGVHIDGGMQEFALVNSNQIFKIPNSLSNENATLIEPFTIAAQATSRGGVKKENLVCIIGAGAIGLSILKVSKMIGAKTVVFDIDERRLDRAKSFGASNLGIDINKNNISNEFTNHHGFDVVIDAACTSETFEKSIQFCAKGGTVVTLGFTKQISKISQYYITKNELNIVGSRLHNNKFETVLKWVENSKINLDGFVTHRFHYTEINDAISMLLTPYNNICKAVIDFN